MHLFNDDLPDSEHLAIINALDLEAELKAKSDSRLSKDEAQFAATFLRDCLNADPSARSSAHDLLGHKWLRAAAACTCGWGIEEEHGH